MTQEPADDVPQEADPGTTDDVTEAVSFDRRRLLLAGAGAVAFVAAQPWRHIVDVVDVPHVERLADVLPATDSTRRVGLAYLHANPEEADPTTLVGALTRSLDVARGDLAAHAAEVVHAELRARTTIRLDGWVASPTEARLAALTTLVRS